MKKILFLSLVLLILSCSSNKINRKQQALETTLNGWIGKHISQAIGKWGGETKISDDGKGGKVYLWRKVWQTNAYYRFGVYQPPQDRFCDTNLYVDGNGFIYTWQYNGHCY
jgi:hypothetical protein